MIFSSELAIPDAARVIVHDMAASPDGGFGAAGSAYSAGGAGTAFIAWLDPSGACKRIVRTYPFSARRISFTIDGTLWAFGREHTAEFEEVAEHNVLRRYGPDGFLLKSLLSRQSFPRYDRRHPMVGSFLVSSPDRLGLYSTAAKEWVEVSFSGDVLGRWKGAEVPLVVGVALTPSGLVYLAGQQPVGRGKQQVVLYRLDKATGLWQALDSPGMTILGTDENYIIAAYKLPQVGWVRAE